MLNCCGLSDLIALLMNYSLYKNKTKDYSLVFYNAFIKLTFPNVIEIYNCRNFLRPTLVVNNNLSFHVTLREIAVL